MIFVVALFAVDDHHHVWRVTILFLYTRKVIIREDEKYYK